MVSGGLGNEKRVGHTIEIHNYVSRRSYLWALPLPGVLITCRENQAITDWWLSQQKLRVSIGQYMCQANDIFANFLPFPFFWQQAHTILRENVRFTRI